MFATENPCWPLPTYLGVDLHLPPSPLRSRLPLYQLLAVATLVLSVACSAPPTDAAHQSELAVPELLQRSAAVQHGTEWASVQSAFQQHALAFRQNPSSAPDALALVELYVQEARVTGEHGHYYPGALALTDHVLALDDLDKDMRFYALTLRSGVQLSQHDFAAALTTGQAAATLRPQDAQAQGVLVDAYVELGDYEAAIAASDAMMARRPDLRSYARVSYLREIHGDLDGAKEAMLMAVRSGIPGTEETSWATLELAQLLDRTGDTYDAEQVLLILLEQRPDYPFALGALAEMQLRKGNTASTKTYLDRAIKAIPEVGFYVTLAEYYREVGDDAAFAKTLSEIEVMLADDVASGHNMDLEYAEVQFELRRDPAAALNFLERLYAARPDNIDVNRELARTYRALGNETKVDFHLERAARTHSKHPELVELTKRPAAAPTG